MNLSLQNRVLKGDSRFHPKGPYILTNTRRHIAAGSIPTTTRNTWDDNIKMNLKQMCQEVGWIHMVQDGVQ
jgi:hypothetical protein